MRDIYKACRNIYNVNILTGRCMEEQEEYYCLTATTLSIQLATGVSIEKTDTDPQKNKTQTI